MMCILCVKRGLDAVHSIAWAVYCTIVDIPGRLVD